jgi:OmcA/MtrC family decaheme c-type cytochrome
MTSRSVVVGVVCLMAVVAGCSSSSRCSVTTNTDGTATLHCDDGTSFTVRNGTNGMDGTNCSVMMNMDGSRTISCTDGTRVTIHDGTNGTNGMNGTTGPSGTPGRNALLTGPGLRSTITMAGIGTDLHPFVEVRFTDAQGRPLDRTGMYTEGAIDAGFTAAHLPTEVRTDGTAVLTYTNYFVSSVTSADGMTTAMQPQADSGGTWTDVDVATGTYRYVFAGTVPSTYPAAETHRIGMYATRTFDGVRYVTNATSTFRPDGMAITVTREIVTNTGCDTCHTPVSAHGGVMEDTELCVTCHSRGMADPDTGESLDFERMIHRIHRGEHLPSVAAGNPMHILDGTTDHDFSNVAFPQDIRNCAVCHRGTDANLAMTQPSRAACGSCHDDIYFDTGTPASWQSLHPGGDRPDDSRCTVCHAPTGGLSPIVDRHFTNYQRPTAQVPALTIDAVTLTATRTIQLDFTVTMNGAPRDILASPMTSLSAVVAGPTTDYLFNASFTLTTASQGTLSAIDAPNGHFRWVSAQTVDTIATNANADPLRSTPGLTITPSGTWAIGMQATQRVNDTATTTSCTGTSTTNCTTVLGTAPEGASWGCVSSLCTAQRLYAAINPVAYFAITDTTPVPRRQVVTVTQCNNCHSQLALHGGGRDNPEYCTLCHNSTFDTIDRMPVPAGGTATTHTLSLAHFIHRTHTGARGVTDATYWGPAPNPRPTPGTGGTPVTFNELMFPADRRVCETCHTTNAAGFDLDALHGLRSPRTRLITDTRTTLATYTQGVTASACTGCHDVSDVAAHAEAMTTATGTESCTVCHAPGEAYGIDRVHARPVYDLR